MPLLPGGDDERASRLYQIAFAVVVLWLGYQGWLNLHRYNTIASNLSTLIGELNIGGEAQFRKSVVHVLDLNGVAMDPGAVVISLDKVEDDYLVEVPCEWSLDLHWWQLRHVTTLHNRIHRTQYG